MRIALLALIAVVSAPAQIRVGLIGLDTSHVIAFTKIFNDPSQPNHVPGAKVVAGFTGGSPDIASSRDRRERFTKELREDWGVKIYDDIKALAKAVDAIMIESVDGRKHLPQFKEVLDAGKPVFIDKPLAASLADAEEIARLGKKHNVPWWSSSSLRFSPAVAEVRVEGVTGAISWGPAPMEATHELDLSWYGIHPVEQLFAVMGTGCVRLRRNFTEGADVITGEWSDGRMGVVRTIREGKSGYGVVAFGAKDVKVSQNASGSISYANMLKRVVEFFKTGEPPVPNEETLEVFRFMHAAKLSRERGGEVVDLR